MADASTQPAQHHQQPDSPMLQDRPMEPMPELLDYVREYARQKPEVAALWCFGIGFILGWKLKPW